MCNESVDFSLSTKNKWFSTSLEMWVLVDSSSGVEATSFTYWRKHLTNRPLGHILTPLEVWKDDELLWKLEMD